MAEPPVNQPSTGAVPPSPKEKTEVTLAIPIVITIVGFILSGVTAYFAASIRLENRITNLEASLNHNKSLFDDISRQLDTARGAKSEAVNAAKSAIDAAKSATDAAKSATDEVDGIRKKLDSISQLATAIGKLTPENLNFLKAQLVNLAAIGKLDSNLTDLTKLIALHEGKIADLGMTRSQLAELEKKVASHGDKITDLGLTKSQLAELEKKVASHGEKISNHAERLQNKEGVSVGMVMIPRTVFLGNDPKGNRYTLLGTLHKADIKDRTPVHFDVEPDQLPKGQKLQRITGGAIVGTPADLARFNFSGINPTTPGPECHIVRTSILPNPDEHKKDIRADIWFCVLYEYSGP